MFRDLNFPSFEFRIDRSGEKLLIFDVLRKKNVVLTPEEWVRQHMVRYLIEYRGYPKSLIRVEAGLKYDKLGKRSDILVYDHQGRPFMVIECKSPEIKLDENVLHQVATYSKSLETRYIGVSNGLKHYCWAVDIAHQRTSALKDFPAYE